MPFFEYKPGRPVKGATRAPELPKPPTWTHDDHDPFPSVEETARRPLEERVSWLADVGLWAQQLVSECATLARKYDALKTKLEDPKLADNPHRLKAVHRAEELWDDMVQAARDAMWTIAEGDRAWQTLTWKQRDEIAGHWHTPSEVDTLVGHAWIGMASFETWPRRFRFSRLWFNDFPEPLIRDLHESSIWTWLPGPEPADPWPEDGRMPAKVAEQLHERGAL